MAIYTTPQAELSYPIPGSDIAGVKCSVWGKFQADEELFAGDVIEMCRVPAASTITGGWFRGDRLDDATPGNETFGINVGYKGTIFEDRPHGLGRLGILYPYGFSGYVQGAEGYCYPFQADVQLMEISFDEEAVVLLTVTADALSFIPGRLSVVVDYIQKVKENIV